MQFGMSLGLISLTESPTITDLLTFTHTIVALVA